MDPDTNFSELTELVLGALARGPDARSAPSDAQRMAEVVEAQVEWQLSGGFPPEGTTSLVPMVDRRAHLREMSSAARALLAMSEEAQVEAETGLARLVAAYYGWPLGRSLPDAWEQARPVEGRDVPA